MLRGNKLQIVRSGRKIITSVSLSISLGERVGILGGNGAGKTTLLRVFAGLLRPEAGTVSWDDHCIFSDGGSYRAACGFAPEVPALYESLTPEEHIQFCAGLYGISRISTQSIIDRLSDQFGLEPFLRRPSSTLSKGQRQRVHLALALVHDPEVVLLDEPFSGLDAQHQERLEELIRNGLNGKIVLLCSHSAERIRACCHRQAVLKDGKLSALCSTAHVTERRAAANS